MRRLHILLPGDADLRVSDRARNEICDSISLAEIKKQLVKNNLLRYGAGISDTVARTMFVSMREVGSMRGSDVQTQWHNATAPRVVRSSDDGGENVDDVRTALGRED